MATAEFFGEVPAVGALERDTVVDAERLLRGLSVTEVGVVTSGGTAGATTGGAGATAEATGDASLVELTAKSFSYDREYKVRPPGLSQTRPPCFTSNAPVTVQTDGR